MKTLMLNDVNILGDGCNPILTVPQLSLEKGTFLVLKGISGAGKSTFLNAITGLITPSRGEIKWNDTDIVKLSNGKKAQFRRDNMGLIFQDFPLFEELSLFENITMAKNYQPQKKVVIEANAKKLMAHFAFDDLQRESKTYSGGQKQRIAFMRALVTDPAIIIADEPTAALDRANAQLMTDFLLEQQANKTLIVASHDDYVLSKADRILTVDGGHIVEGTVSV